MKYTDKNMKNETKTNTKNLLNRSTITSHHSHNIAPHFILLLFLLLVKIYSA